MLLASPRARPSMALLADVPALLSPLTLSNQLGDEPTRRKRLSPEQNAFVSGCLSLVAVAVASSVGGARKPLFSVDVRSALGLLGGVFHFTAYLSTLCAFSSASSTVITPLMQLSAVWMLPFSCCAAFLGLANFIQPAHLLSVILICAGGFLPATDGSLSSVATGKFWQQHAVRYVALGELLICCYNVILHQATFQFTGTSDLQSSSLGGPGPFHFFLVSRVANGLTCTVLFLLVPSLRRHLKTLHEVEPCCLVLAVLGEFLSMAGVCLVTFSYSGFYEPSVVNAVEGGLQQLFNLLFAVISHRVLGLGRGVEQVPVKCASLLLVSAGLMLSTT